MELGRVTPLHRRLLAAHVALTAAEDDQRNAVIDCRKAGVPWSEIAERIGVTKQAAQQRYGPHCEP